MQVWSVIAQKGGQSKTTITTGFAVEAAIAGLSVVILDADDRQGSSLFWAERRGEDDKILVKDSGVAALPLNVEKARKSGKVDLLIIDTPANSRDIATTAADLSDFVIIPVVPRGLDVHSVLTTVKQVKMTEKPFAVLPTQVAATGSEDADTREGFEGKGVRLFKTSLRLRKDYYRATADGKTAVETAPSSAAATEIKAAFAEAMQLSGLATKRKK